MGSDLIYAANSNGCIDAFCTRSRRQLGSYRVSRRWINSIVAKPGGEIICGTTEGHIYQITESDRGEPVLSFRLGRWINDLTVSDDDNVVLAFDGGGSVTLLDNRCPKNILNTGSCGWSIVFVNGSEVFACGSAAGTVTVGEICTGKIIYSVRLHNGPVTSVASTGSRILSVGYDGYLCILDLDDLNLTRIRLHRDRIWQVLATSKFAYTIGGDRALRQFDLKEKSVKVEQEFKTIPLTFCRSRNQNVILVGFNDGDYMWITE